MDIKEMHNAFLVLGQQMGMQSMRNILPSEIDVFLNAAIIEEVRKSILSNVNTAFNDKVTIQKNTVSPINFVRTLYAMKAVSTQNSNSFDFEDDDVMYFTSIFVKYESEGLYNCRLIEQDELANTLNDYCNGASFDYPIASMSVFGESKSWVIYNNNEKTVQTAIVNYIKNPAKVDYANNVNCDLPEYTHQQIVETAINKYFASVGSTTN